MGFGLDSGLCLGLDLGLVGVDGLWLWLGLGRFEGCVGVGVRWDWVWTRLGVGA